MLPTRAEAEALLREAEPHNPGLWADHSRTAARCAERIARACSGLDPDKAYILGLLHDIGRRFGARHLGHVIDGYRYMRRLGYDEAARICLTHSFKCGDNPLGSYIGKFDLTDEEMDELQAALRAAEPDEYDALIQLCDAIAGAGMVMDIEERMADVRRRYGSYPQEKWDANLALRARFERRMGRDLYEVVCPGETGGKAAPDEGRREHGFSDSLPGAEQGDDRDDPPRAL